MKRNLLVTTAAAALLIGTVFAAAQGVQRQGAEPGMQGGAQTAPSEGKGKAQSKEPRTQGQGQREQGQREQGQREGQQQQQPKTKGKEQAQPKEPGTRGQGQREQGEREGQQQQPKTKGKEQAQPKEPGTRGQGQREQGQREGQQQQPKQQPQQGQQTPRGDTQKTQKGAEGKAGAEGGDVKLSTEQRTKIRSTVLQGGDAPRVSNVDFSVSVGTVVPRERVKLVAVPPTLVEIRPAWRGYLYFIVGERIIIVEPSSYRIVAVLVV